MNEFRLVAVLVLTVSSACGDDGGGEAGADAAPVTDAGADSSLPDAANPGPTEVVLTTHRNWVPTPAAWVAVQAGDGPWQRQGSDDGEYRFETEDGRYAVAVMCDEVPRRLYITRATAAELPSLWHECVTFGTGKLEVTLASAPEAGAWVWLGSGGFGASAAAPQVLFQAVPPGRYDLVATHDPDQDGSPEEIAILRDVAVADDATASATIDLDDAVATSPFSFAVDDANAPDNVARTVFFVAAGGARVSLARLTTEAGGYRGLGGAALDDGDRHLAHAETNGVPDHQESVWAFFRDAKNLELELPAPFTVSSVSTAATTPSVRIEASFDAYPEASYYQLNAGHLSLLATAGWLGDGERHVLEQPDLSEVDGWQNAWALSDGVQVSYRGAAFTGPVFPGYLENHTFGFRAAGVADGAVATRATHSGQFTP